MNGKSLLEAVKRFDICLKIPASVLFGWYWFSVFVSSLMSLFASLAPLLTPLASPAYPFPAATHPPRHHPANTHIPIPCPRTVSPLVVSRIEFLQGGLDTFNEAGGNIEGTLSPPFMDV